MSGPAPIFREIHRLRRFARDLQEQLERIPRQMKVFQARLAKHEQALRDGQETIKRLKVTASEKEKTLKSRHETIERFQKQINDVSAKKEYDALQLEIAHAKTECSQLEDAILTAMTDSEEASARLPELEKAVKLARDEVTKFETDTGPRKTDLEAQLKETQAQLKKVEGTIPSDLRSQYIRAIASHGADAMAAVIDRVCDSCSTEITAQSQNELAQGMFLLCRSCGRILYLPQSAVTASDDE
jgi:predicted  nucleic acid-binding Zn-ribbon protein